jgi:hypothetical protein
MRSEKGKAKGKIFVQEYSRGVPLHPSSFAREGGKWGQGRGGFARRLLPSGGPGLGIPAGAFIVELGAALRLHAGSAPLFLQVSRGRRVSISPGGLV